LNRYIFTLMMDEIIRYIQEDISYCILYADDMVLIDENMIEIVKKIELRRQILESKDFRLCRTKIEYI
jgi:hypothetical protein